MKAFWSAGFEGASVEAMCRAMNMSRASLYQVYGSKEGLFLAAIGHYGESRLRPLIEALGPRGSLADDMTAFFSAVVDLATADPQAPGCLISCALADASGTNIIFRKELDRRFSVMETRIAERLRLANWPHDARTPPAPAAGLAAAAARGIMLRARSGRPAGKLSQIAAAGVSAVLSLHDE